MIKNLLLIVFVSMMTLDAVSQKPSIENLRRHVYTLASDSMMGRLSASPGGYRAGEYIAGEFRKIGLRPLVADSSYFHNFIYNAQFDEPVSLDSNYLQNIGDTVRFGNPRNILGYIPGTDAELSREYIVIGAHYDHLGFKKINNEIVVYNGADDNASGVAAMIELARYFKDNPQPRSLLFVAFDAEESGLYGSKFFVNNSPVELSQIKLMYSLDMVGYLTQSGKLEYVGTGTLAQGDRIIPSAQEVGYRVVTKPFDTNFLSSTDHEPFAKGGIPTLYVTTGFTSPYHQPQDDANRIDYGGLRLVVQHVAEVTRIAAAEPRLEPSGQQSPKHTSYSGSRPKSELEFHAMLGMGGNNHYYVSSSATGKNAFAVNAGIRMRWKFRSPLALETGAIYEHRYARAAGGEFYQDRICIPLNAMIITVTKGFVGAHVQLGGYYAYNLFGRAQGEAMNFDLYNRSEWGLSCGAGIRLGRCTITLCQKWALSNLTKVPVPVIYGEAPINIRNRSFTVEVSIKL